MKPTLSPARTARLARIIAELDAFYRDAHQDDLETFMMSKLSTACGDLSFVLERSGAWRPEQGVVLERSGAAR